MSEPLPETEPEYVMINAPLRERWFTDSLAPDASLIECAAAISNQELSDYLDTLKGVTTFAFWEPEYDNGIYEEWQRERVVQLLAAQIQLVLAAKR